MCGYGSRRAEFGEYTLDEAAHDILTLADKFGFDRFSLLGHSMGGAIAQRVLMHAPDRVRAIFGISPVPASAVDFDEQSWALFAGAGEQPGNRREIINITTGNRLTSTWLDAMMQFSLDAIDPRALSGFLPHWANANFASEVQGSQLPVKAVVGDQDPAITESTIQETFGKIYPNCEIEVFPNVGHYAIDEAPVMLATSIEKFLSAGH